MSWQRQDLSHPEFERPTEGPAIGRFLYLGARTGIVGAPETTKTLTALIVALEHLRAGHGAFAVVDFETGAHETRRRLHELGATLEEIASVYYVSPETAPTAEDLAAIEAAGVKLVIIDAAAGAYGVSGLDDNNRTDAETFANAWINPLWQRGITTVVLDHVVKNTENRGRYAIGSERKLGALDVQIGLEAIQPFKRGSKGVVKFTVHKDRPGHLRRPHPVELHLTSDPETHQITWLFKEPEASGESDAIGETWRPTVLMDRVVMHLNTQTEPLSRNQIVSAVTGKREYVLRAIDCLLAEHKLVPEGRKLTLNRFPVPNRFPEPLGTTEPGNHRFPVPLSTEGTTSGNHFGAVL